MAPPPPGRHRGSNPVSSDSISLHTASNPVVSESGKSQKSEPTGGYNSIELSRSPESAEDTKRPQGSHVTGAYAPCVPHPDTLGRREAGQGPPRNDALSDVFKRRPPAMPNSSLCRLLPPSPRQACCTWPHHSFPPYSPGARHAPCSPR